MGEAVMKKESHDPTQSQDTPEISLDDPAADIEAAMRDALSAVEAVEADAPQANRQAPAAASAAGRPGDPPAPAAAAPPGTAGTSETQETSETSEIETLRQEIADLRDRSLRTLADFDNFRKRAERERQEIRRYALLEPLREFLPIADNLERALSAGGSAEDLKRGVELILRQMQDLLRRFGAREVPSDGESFNPMVHEAVARVESDQVTVPTVTETLVRGYMLLDRLLRPAMVKVAVPPESAGSRPAQESSPLQSSDGKRDGGRGEPAI
jgi:molecular chaperone GrpE